MRLYDCHLHLQDERFAGQLEAVLGRAATAGVARMFCNGTREEDWPRLLALARAHPAIVPFFGLHPWFVADRSPEWLDRLREYLALRPAGLGEIGLDRACRVPLAEQLPVLAAQLALARERELPVAIHCVRAWGKLRELLAGEGAHAPGIILHGYAGPAEMVASFLALGAYFSFSFAGFGPEAFPPALALVPAERLLLESDAPYRCPDPELVGFAALTTRGINEPANIEYLYRRVAQVRGVSVETLATSVADNGERLRAKLPAMPLKTM